MSSYNFLEGQVPEIIHIQNTFSNDLSDSNPDLSCTFFANETLDIKTFVERIQGNLQLTSDLSFGGDSFIGFQRARELFPTLIGNNTFTGSSNSFTGELTVGNRSHNILFDTSNNTFNKVRIFLSYVTINYQKTFFKINFFFL